MNKKGFSNIVLVLVFVVLVGGAILALPLLVFGQTRATSEKTATSSEPITVIAPRITPALENLAKTSPDQLVQVVIATDPSERNDVLNLAESLGGKFSIDDPRYNSPDLPLFITIKAGRLLDLAASKYIIAIFEPGVAYSQAIPIPEKDPFYIFKTYKIPILFGGGILIVLLVWLISRRRAKIN